jgi:phosphoribosylformimino-5-aminoimidazole carboxamide ribotide isomerase
MEIIPAIDLSAGRVVRLRQGDFDRVTDYGDDPAAVALRWVDEGAKRLHVVDLDGARAGRPVQADPIRSVIAAVSDRRVAIQVAGGLRTIDGVEAALATGASRIVLGTALLREPEFATRLIEQHGVDTIVAALDVRDGLAVGEAWRAGAAGPTVDAALDALHSAGVRIFAVTAIARDGLLEGPDLALLTRIRTAAPGIELIASGGVGTLDDVRALVDIGADAAIIGRALYDGAFDVTDAIRAAS